MIVLICHGELGGDNRPLVSLVRVLRCTWHGRRFVGAGFDVAKIDGQWRRTDRLRTIYPCEIVAKWPGMPDEKRLENARRRLARPKTPEQLSRWRDQLEREQQDYKHVAKLLRQGALEDMRCSD